MHWVALWSVFNKLFVFDNNVVSLVKFGNSYMKMILLAYYKMELRLINNKRVIISPPQREIT